jgi:hypothetical protein
MALTKLTQNLIDGTIVTSVNGSSGAVTLETGTDWISTIQTSNFTAVAGKGYFVNTTSAEITVTLPAGIVGNEVIIQDYAGTFATNKVIFASNGSEKIQGSTDDYKNSTNNSTITLVYQDATKGWTADNIETNAVPVEVYYLVVAGGGSGGANSNSGGGGAGGYRTNFGGTGVSISVATNYLVTIGAGGAGEAPQAAPGNGNNGINSVFNNITSTGGGRGSGQGGSAASGGSGGGGGYDTGGASGNAGNYTPVEGYAGGAGVSAGSYPGGGGGGASEAGNTDGNGHGGDGVSNSINGASTIYAGGGSGGVAGGSSIIPGGDGGGGAGSNNTATSQAGTANTGGGSGGGAGSYGSGNGGSGIVILRYPNTLTISGLSGTTTTVGSDKVTTFTSGTGNIQFN